MSDLRRALLILVSTPVAAGLVAPGDWRRQAAIGGVYVCALCALAPWSNDGD